MLMIRLSRVGKKKKAEYRLVIQDKKRDPWGKVLEILGTYNPHTKELTVKEDRVAHWRSVGAQMSATVNNLLIDKKIIEGEKVKATKINKKKKKEKGGEAKKEGDKPVEDKKEEVSEEKVEDKKEEKPAEEKVEEKKEEAKEEKKPAEEKTEGEKEEVKEDKKEEEK